MSLSLMRTYIQRSAQVGVAYVKAGKACAFDRENAVEDEFDHLQGYCFSAGVAGVTDPVATNCDARTVWARLLRAVFTDHSCVCNVTAATNGDGAVGYRTESIRALDSFVVGVHGIPTNTLAEPPEFICV